MKTLNITEILEENKKLLHYILVFEIKDLKK